MELILKCKGLAAGYEGHTVLENINLTVEKGEFVSIVGENGSGKSTLIKVLLGLLPPTAGSFEYKTIKQNEIGYLPQTSQMQRDFPTSVREVVLSGFINQMGNRFFYSRDEKLSAEKQMQELGILDLKKESFQNLSGGQRQRVLLARALCSTQQVLLLDEPVTGLDPGATADLYRIINELNQNKGITVIMVTHDIAAALKYSDKILHIRKEPLFMGSVAEYLKTELFCAGKGSDYSGNVN